MTTIPQQPQQSHRKAPGILRLLPETLPFYKYQYTIDKKTGRLPSSSRKRRQKQKQNDLNSAEQQPDTMGNTNDNVIPNAPLHNQNNSVDSKSGFTLFFFVDSTNRQSLLALPLVSRWFHHALSSSTTGDDISNYGDINNDENDIRAGRNNNNNNNNRIICIPNHPSPHEIDTHNSTINAANSSDPIVQASINSSTTSITGKCPTASMLSNTGFYHLPFLHSKRLPLLHLLGANRVPCVIVVSNTNGRIVTRLGWEAIEREMSVLEQWLLLVENKKECDGDDRGFESEAVKQWSVGNSGLPFWWHLLSWIV